MSAKPKDAGTAADIAALEARIARLEAVVGALTRPALKSCKAMPERSKKVRQIIAEVAAEYGVPASAIVGDSRLSAVTVPRQEAMRRAKDAGLTLAQIGRLMGGRDHTTVMHGIKRARERLAAE